MGFGVWGLGFGVWGLGLGIWDLGMQGSESRSPKRPASKTFDKSGVEKDEIELHCVHQEKPPRMRGSAIWCVFRDVLWEVMFEAVWFGVHVGT